MTLLPWARGPFELLVHAELHFQAGAEFDRRVASVGFDNAIEVAVTCYLELHPSQRGGRTYENKAVEVALNNFPSKIEFFIQECDSRQLDVKVGQGHYMHYHKIRNEQYHEGRVSVPTWDDLTGAREAAVWAFGVLFDVEDVEDELATAVRTLYAGHDRPERDDLSDRAIDGEYGTVDVGGTPYYTSELLYSMNPGTYRDIAAEARAKRDVRDVGT